jgi:colanic acid/amylovoran biosynthesis protein
VRRILITNAVPSNGGDEALLLSTILGIKKVLSDVEFTVLCNDADNVRKHIDYVNIDWDWEYTIGKGERGFFDLLKRKFRSAIRKFFGIRTGSRFSLLLAGKIEKSVLKLYRDADYIVSSAGGYIHDIYGYEARVEAYKIAIRSRRKLIFFGQSIGPFFRSRSHIDLLKIFGESYKIILREERSLKHLTKIGYSGSNVSVSTDIAFALYNHLAHLFKEKKVNGRKVVVSFREWTHYGDPTIALRQGGAIVSYLVSCGYHVTFLSTCQGLEHYVDDSKLARKIFDELPVSQKSFFYVDSTRYDVPGFISKYSEFDAYIGMRLHGAILAMLGGTPAFSLGYEDKSAGIYAFCGIGDYQIDFDCDLETILERIDDFLSTYESLQLRPIVERAARAAADNFLMFE